MAEKELIMGDGSADHFEENYAYKVKKIRTI